MEIYVGDSRDQSIIYSVDCGPSRNWKLVNKIAKKYKDVGYGVKIKIYITLNKNIYNFE